MFTIEDRIKRVMVLTMLADGEIEDDEIASIRAQYGELTGRTLTVEQVQREAADAQADGLDVAAYLSPLGRSLDDEDRRMIIRCAHAVASSDGYVLEEEEGTLHDIARALGMDNDAVTSALEGLELA
jgi:uncharacterized tellurite resistance protein B-like protein